MRSNEELVDIVRTERRRRGWSIRRAATEGGVSNETWGVVERGAPIGPKMQQAVMHAFGWPETWQTDEVAAEVDRVVALEARMDDVVIRLEDLESRLVRLAAQIAKVIRQAPHADGRPDGDSGEQTHDTP